MVKEVSQKMPENLEGFIIEHENKIYVLKCKETKKPMKHYVEETIALEGFLIKLIKEE